MTEERNDNPKKDTFRWLVTSLIALLAAGGGIAAIVNMIHTTSNSNSAANQASIGSRESAVSQQSPNSPRPQSSIKSDGRNESLISNNNGNSIVASKIECKVDGAVYDFDKNNSPMANVRVYLIDDKHPEVFLGRTDPNGIFTADCSQIPPDNFPKKMKILTASGLSLIEQELPIFQEGRKGLSLYVSESNIKIARNRASIIKQIQSVPNKINPSIYKELANKR